MLEQHFEHIDAASGGSEHQWRRRARKKLLVCGGGVGGIEGSLEHREISRNHCCCDRPLGQIVWERRRVEDGWASGENLVPW